VNVGVGAIFTVTPLFQINFFPDFTQVYLKDPIIFVEFTFEHLVPEIDAALAG
jgi:hypothetical protein